MDEYVGKGGVINTYWEWMGIEAAKVERPESILTEGQRKYLAGQYPEKHLGEVEPDTINQEIRQTLHHGLLDLILLKFWTG
jgi:hypothetical protein